MKPPELSKTVIPAAPGWWVHVPQGKGTWRDPVIAWCVLVGDYGFYSVKPITVDPMGDDQLIEDPEGRLSEYGTSFQTVEHWLADLNKRVKIEVVGGNDAHS